MLGVVTGISAASTGGVLVTKIDKKLYDRLYAKSVLHFTLHYIFHSCIFNRP